MDLGDTQVYRHVSVVHVYTWTGVRAMAIFNNTSSMVPIAATGTDPALQSMQSMAMCMLYVTIRVQSGWRFASMGLSMAVHGLFLRVRVDEDFFQYQVHSVPQVACMYTMV